MKLPRRPAKGWQEKSRVPGEPVVKRAPISIAGMKAGQIMLVPTPQLIEAFMRGLPWGKSVDVKSMRAELAKRYRAEVTCPIYTGYHLRTVAEAAYEQHLRGAPFKDIAPFWRVIDAKTPTIKRLACGAEFVRTRRAEEGIAP